ncbi:MAG: hypothetical protein IJM61_04145 [Firmicutes bacterium]|nr:hypothetical protein [Bacillota bacterium]
MSGKLASISILLEVLLIAAVLAVIYYIIYRIRINRALRKEDGAERSAGPEPANVTRNILVIVLIVALGITMIRIADLNTKVDELNNDLNNTKIQLVNGLNSISSQISKQTSLFSDTYMTTGVLDEGRYAHVHFRVTPKAASLDTEVSININGETYHLNIAGGDGRDGDGHEYVGNLVLDILNYYNTPTLIIKQDGITRTEPVEFFRLKELRMQYMPFIQSDTTLNTTVTGADGKTAVNWDGHIELISKTGYSNFLKEGIKLITIVDGKVAAEKDISSEIYWTNTADPYMGSYDYAYRDSFNSNEVHNYALAIEAKDSIGYTHRYYLKALNTVNGACMSDGYLYEVVTPAGETVKIDLLYY